MVSPYLVLGDRSISHLPTCDDVAYGLAILTSSLDSTDSLAAHAAYAHQRRALPSSGVELFEMRLQAGIGRHGLSYRWLQRRRAACMPRSWSRTGPPPSWVRSTRMRAHACTTRKIWLTVHHGPGCRAGGPVRRGERQRSNWRPAVIRNGWNGTPRNRAGRSCTTSSRRPAHG